MKLFKASFAACAALAIFTAGAQAASATDAEPSTVPPPASNETPAPALAWDQAANIREAAERLGALQRTRGAKGAFEFIGACYRTQGLAENYAAPFEACIAQDYMQTQVLALIYSRLSVEQLQTMHAPTPAELAQSMGQRIDAAFSQYKISATYANDFKKMVDKHGFPVFLAMVFPNAKVPTSPSAGASDGVPKQDNKPSSKP